MVGGRRAARLPPRPAARRRDLVLARSARPTERPLRRPWRDMLDGEDGGRRDARGAGPQGALAAAPRRAAARLASPASARQALGPQDYLAIAAHFHTVFLEDVPKLTPEQRDGPRGSSP